MSTNDTARKWLTRLSLAAGIAFTAHAEYDLARSLGADPAIAAMLPVAVDAYVMAALRWFKGFDIALSLTLMGAAQIAAHLLDARVMVVNIPVVVVVSLLVPIAIWRTHALAREEHAESTAEDTPASVTAPLVTRPLGGPEVSAEVSDEVTLTEAQARPALAPAPPVKPLVICGDRRVWPLVVTPRDTDDEVSDGVSGEVTERLPADAALAVIEKCWVRGTSPTETARVSTRSASYVKKVFGRLDEARGPQPMPGQMTLVPAEVAS
ncbi:hypothetical protein SLUN_12955 [Streptomyces lunaelactis]|uniref:DUF2637 domain-containing protein n=1 Tax=Streptomyces lunaelactis TaxID=1535768 RepID=A0A2R4T1F9_9ACTN|nr:hypothetical protein [Streptomyces lunaelactis]AVZ72966.1 hypothetical protein SLUN_12955 [Streptomyces lunaelactis]NUK87136.1 hypothetical protein [Streptomyces lunaelactis]